ncbi:MAG TPA: histidine phosphatase family protein [Gaiellaceae bacterium]|jgi:broad specificity phosphatase PhoE|nr:histidine phosphatase family protein [Gaiellaceae bacterium]
MASEIVLVRHGETEWSRDGRHTSRTDVPLTELGRAQADLLAAALEGQSFARVLTSPLVRAAETARRAGFDAEPRDELREWDYGAYEGRKTVEIREDRPGWTLWRDGVPDGETAAEVAERADRLIDELRAVPGDVLVFGHGHLLRVLAARWLGLEPEAGRLLALGTATISVLGYERETPVIRIWNAPVDAESGPIGRRR